MRRAPLWNVLGLAVAGLATLCPLASAVEEGEGESGWVEGKLATMTLREKLGQMIMVDVPGTAFDDAVKAQMNAGDFGSVLLLGRNIQEEEQVKVLIHEMQTNAVVRTGIPLLVAVDQEGGLVNRVGPLTHLKTTKYSARTIGQVYEYDPRRAGKLVASLTGELAKRMHALGFNMNLAPVLDVTDDRASFIYDRSYGGDPDVVSRVSSRFAATMQENGVIATGKHFPNLSSTHPDSHKALPVLERSLDQLEQKEFVPFRRIRRDLGAIMVGHVIVPDLDPKYPASISAKAVKTLRDRVGWQGVVITDDIKMKALSDHYPLLEILVRAVFADVDIMMVAWGKDKQKDSVDILERAVTQGKISTARIDRSVRRILALKYRFAVE